MSFSTGAPRILFYSHDSYGLGHLRRTLALAHRLHARWPAAAQLIVTGSPSPQHFPFPETADYVKLPSVVKVGAGRYEARSLSVSFDDIWTVRRDVLLATARTFRPDLLIVDNVPPGLKGELVPTLHYLKQSGQTRLVLALRDIVDAKERVVQGWSHDSTYDLLDDVYDLILVYGDQVVYDLVAEYNFSPRAAAKTSFVGYIRHEPTARSVESVRAELGLRTDRLVLIGAGGGGDGYEVLRTALEGLRLGGAGLPFDCLVVAGPFMPVGEREALRRLLPEGPYVHFREFVKDLSAYVAAADAVVSMGGYNSVCEILSCQRPALIVPRVEPRREQLIRAEALSRRGLLRMVHPAHLTPARLLAEVHGLLERPPRRPSALAMDGLVGAAAELEAVLHPSAARPVRRPSIAAGVD